MKFQMLADQYHWDDERRLSKLVEALDDKALTFYGGLPVEIRTDYYALLPKFAARFQPQDMARTARNKLKVVKIAPEETLEEFAERTQRLASDAWGDENAGMVELTAKEAFLHGQLDTDAAWSAMQKEPDSLDEALQFVKMAIHDKKSLLANGRGVMKTRTVGFNLDSEPTVRATSPARSESPLASSDTSQKVEKLESDFKSMQGDISKILNLLQSTPRSSSPGRAGGGSVGPCDFCGKMGHLRRDCWKLRNRSPPPSPQRRAGGELAKDGEQKPLN